MFNPADETRWFKKALCAQIGGDIFFPDAGEPTNGAKAVCHNCPVAYECREFALKNNINYGIWGGTTPRQRKRISKHRAREAKDEPIMA